MRKFWIAGVAALAIAGSTAVVYAHQHRGHWGHMRMAPEDRAAFVDARIAAVHAGLKLNADQEKLWPPLEAAVREFAKQRIDRANARMNAPADAPKPDPVTRLRERADNMAASAAAMPIEKITNMIPVSASGCSLKRQNAMKFKFAALSMSSMPMSTMMALRRVNAPARPMAKSMAERRR